MQQRQFLKANSYSSGREIFHVDGTLIFNTVLTTALPLVHILSQMNPFHDANHVCFFGMLKTVTSTAENVFFRPCAVRTALSFRVHAQGVSTCIYATKQTGFEP